MKLRAGHPLHGGQKSTIYITYPDPQAKVHLRGDSADHDGPAASTSETRNRQHYDRPRHVSFDELSHNPANLAVENFGRLRVEGNVFIDQLAASVVGGRDGGSIATKVKERLLQLVSMTTPVTISRVTR